MRVKSGTTTAVRPASIFFSYAHRDEEFREQLGRHLSFLWRSGEVAIWHDRMITGGQDWAGEIDRRLREADIILLLVSADFAASDYCWDVEMQAALIRHELGEAVVVPVILRPAEGWHASPLGRLQALPRNGMPVSSWDDRDEAYADIVRGLQSIITERLNYKPEQRPSLVEWSLQTTGVKDDFPQERLNDLSLLLRKASSDLYLMPDGMEEGSVQLRFISTPAGYEALQSLHERGELESILEIPIQAIHAPVGATVRIEVRTVTADDEALATFLSPSLKCTDAIWPPFVTGLAYPVEDFLKLGFLLGRHPDHRPEQSEVLDLQARLGRYLNTMLVVSGENLNVNLSPEQEWGGLTPPLRGTELGRDLLDQDLELKRQVTRLLYPGDEPGKRFWDEVGEDAPNGEVGTFIRVWIVPGQAAVHEEVNNGLAQIDIEKMQMRVLSEIDYTLLRSAGDPEETARSRQDRIAEAFRTTILPAVQQAVDTGPRFGQLRQIYSVLVLAKWIKERLGSALANFINTNDTGKFQVEGAQMAAHRIQNEYARLIEQGGFRYPVRRIDGNTGMVVHRVYVAGGIDLRLRTLQA